jgi:hypothetical protein
VFSEQTVKGYPQLFDFVDELEFWLDLVGDGSEDRVRWRMLEEGEEGGVQDRLDERYHLLRGPVIRYISYFRWTLLPWIARAAAAWDHL